MNNTPFIKKFEIGNSYYIYDVNSNSFFQVDEPVFSLIDNINNSSDKQKKYPNKVIHKALKNIELMKKKGYFSSRKPAITYFHSETKKDFFKDLKEILNEKLYRISLVVTENCNLRCKYCAYSGQYIYHRQHSKRNMSSEIMKKAVDFYFSHSNANKEKNLSFYGGEPLKNFKLIRECVEYVKNKYAKRAEFNMTINGTLLDREKMNFLVKNNFSILISIDGPKEMHDRNRIFKNGKGTFECLTRNLRILKSMYPEYYKKKVRFNMVLTPFSDFKHLHNFFSKSDITPAAIKFTEVSSRYTSFLEQFPQEQLKDYNSARRKLLDSFIHKLTQGMEPTEIEKFMFKHRFLSIHKRDMNKLPPKYPSHGQCMVGTRTLLVNTDGSFNFCTRVEDVFNLGNVYSGYNYKLIEKIYTDLDSFFKDRCYDCWAIRFCMKCIKDVNKNGELNDQIFDQMCRRNKRAILSRIKEYIKIRENNYHALDYLKDVVIA